MTGKPPSKKRPAQGGANLPASRTAYRHGRGANHPRENGVVTDRARPAQISRAEAIGETLSGLLHRTGTATQRARFIAEAAFIVRTPVTHRMVWEHPPEQIRRAKEICAAAFSLARDLEKHGATLRSLGIPVANVQDAQAALGPLALKAPGQRGRPKGVRSPSNGPQFDGVVWRLAEAWHQSFEASPSAATGSVFLRVATAVLDAAEVPAQGDEVRSSTRRWRTARSEHLDSWARLAKRVYGKRKSAQK